MGKADRSGELHKPAVLQAQTKRQLDDPRSRALFDGFGAPWLGVQRLNAGGLQRQVFDRIAAIEARQKEAALNEAAMEKAGVRASKRHASDSPPIEIRIPEGEKRSEYMQVMCDLNILAFQTDMTRVSTYTRQHLH